MGFASYLERFLDPVVDTFTPEVARGILAVQMDDATQSRVDELRRKANLGTLTADEESEYKDFVEAVDVLSMIQAKSRRRLSRLAG